MPVKHQLPFQWPERRARSGQFGYWDLHHSAGSVAVLTERVGAYEAMTLLSQDKEFYTWVSEHELEALDMMWPFGWGHEHTFSADMAPFWTRLVDEYQS